MGSMKIVNVVTFLLSFVIIIGHNSNAEGMYGSCIYSQLEYYINV